MFAKALLKFVGSVEGKVLLQARKEVDVWILGPGLNCFSQHVVMIDGESSNGGIP